MTGESIAFVFFGAQSLGFVVALLLLLWTRGASRQLLVGLLCLLALIVVVIGAAAMMARGGSGVRGNVAEAAVAGVLGCAWIAAPFFCATLASRQGRSAENWFVLAFLFGSLPWLWLLVGEVRTGQRQVAVAAGVEKE